MRPRFAALFVASAWLAGFEAQARPASPPTSVGGVAELVRSQCGRCHDGAARKGGVDLGALLGSRATSHPADVWRRVRDVLRDGDMPPEGEPQPTAEERERLARWAAAAGGGRPESAGHPVARRLTRIEYDHSLRDLLGIDADVGPLHRPFPDARLYLDPSAGRMPTAFSVQTSVKARAPWLRQAGLPTDRRAEHGFSNRGDVLGVSALSFERYFDIAQATVAAARQRGGASGPLARAIAPADPTEAQLAPRALAEQRLIAFAAWAFRRPATAATIAPFLRVFSDALASGATSVDGLARAVSAMLASPRFLLRLEPRVGREATRRLDDWELATRLSYFLWSTTPDAALRDAAARGELGGADGLAAATTRLLRDTRVVALAEVFAFEWLGLDRLVGARPDPTLFPHYYWGELNKHSLAGPMAFEVLLAFETVLVEDRSVLELFDAPWAYLNPALAKHYGLYERYRKAFEAERLRHEARLVAEAEAAGGKPRKPPRADADAIWLRCELPSRERGGVITSGAVLTATSGPRRASPVKRGVWLLETIFNRPPPPPPVVPPLPDTGEAGAAASVRVRLERHRRDPACAGCHARIDPLGFALSGYDATGARIEREADAPVDMRFRLPDGDEGEGAIALKGRLLAKPRELVRGLVEHLLSYAIGRALLPADDAAVDAILDAAARDGWRFSRIVHEVVQSRPFRFIDQGNGADEDAS